MSRFVIDNISKMIAEKNLGLVTAIKYAYDGDLDWAELSEIIAIELEDYIEKELEK